MITCALIIRNEAARIEATLRHVLALDFQEVLVVDQTSDDGTREIVERMREQHRWQMRVEDHPNHGTSEPSRPWVLENARGPWVLLLDADEMLTTWFSTSMNAIAASEKADLYGLDRITWIENDKFVMDAAMLRFMHKDRVVAPVFEKPVQYLHSSVSVLRPNRTERLAVPALVQIKSWAEQEADNERYWGLGYPRP